MADKGYDTVDFSHQTTGVWVHLDGNFAYAGGELRGGGNYVDETEINSIRDFEAIVGSAFGDRLEARFSSTGSIRGGDGDDWIEGGNFRDILYGDDGNDRVYGSSGDDLIYDGLGDDFMNGGVGTDTADFSKRTAAVYVDLTANNALVGGSVDSNGNCAGGTETNSLLGIEEIIGTLYGDQLVGESNVGTKLDGGAGSDWLFGGSDDDIFTGETGNDYVLLNGGSDPIVYGAGDGIDVIEGFGADDLVRLEGLGAIFNDVQNVLDSLTSTPDGAVLPIGMDGFGITF